MREIVLKTFKEKRYLVIVNPVSRGGKAQKEGIWLLNRMKKLGVDYEALFTERTGHAEEMVTEWSQDFDVVVAVSGDGTANEIINGIMKVPNARIKLAMFPAGTADDFACNVGYSRTDRESSLRAILGDSYRTIDLIRYDNRYAAVTFGLGVDSEIADATFKHKRFRVPAYFYSGLKMVFFRRKEEVPPALRIRRAGVRRLVHPGRPLQRPPLRALRQSPPGSRDERRRPGPDHRGRSS